MKSFKMLFVIALAIITVMAGIFVYNTGNKYGEIDYAKKLIDIETKNYTEDNKKLKAQKKDYLKTINKFDSESGDGDNKLKLEEYYSKIKDYETKTTDLDVQINAAKSKLNAVAQYNTNSEGISNEATGETRSLSDGTYTCPSEGFPAGRYRITGTGIFRIVDEASNKVEDSQNLSLLDGNSYTLNIADNTRLITEGAVYITPVH